MIRCNAGVRDSKCSREVLFLVGSFVIGLAATSFLNASLAHDGDDHDHKGKTPQVRKVANAELYAPTPMPDRIVLTWSGDPTTSQSVTWRTSTEVVDGLAEIALATSGPEFVKSATRVKAESVALKTDLNTAHFHSVVFKDLTPGTKYTYRVGDGVNWSEWFQFQIGRAHV